METFLLQGHSEGSQTFIVQVQVVEILYWTLYTDELIEVGGRWNMFEPSHVRQETLREIRAFLHVFTLLTLVWKGKLWEHDAVPLEWKIITPVSVTVKHKRFSIYFLNPLRLLLSQKNGTFMHLCTYVCVCKYLSKSFFLLKCFVKTEMDTWRFCF